MFWPPLNEAEYRARAEPILGAFLDTRAIGPELCRQVTLKRDQVVDEIGYEHVLNMFAGKKALPVFLAFCQTTAAQVTPSGPAPTLVSALVLSDFARCDTYMPIFERMNEALHERA